MSEPFDVTTDESGDTSLTPTFQEPDTVAPEDVGILPNIAAAMGPRPQIPLPAPPPPPQSPVHDPRQQLLALVALGMAIGQGPRGGGAGALHGFMQGQQALQQDQMQQHQAAVSENQQQQRQVAQQQRDMTAALDRRDAEIRRTLINFKTAAMKAPTKAEYDGIAEAYGAALTSPRGFGARNMSANWLRAEIPYMKPSKEKIAIKAFNDWMKNPNNKRILDENPQLAFESVVAVDLNADGKFENIPLPVLAEKAGQGFAKTDQGYIAAPKGVTGNGAFDVKYNALLQQFVAENRRAPKPDERNTIVDQAIAATKVKPEPVVSAGGTSSGTSRGTEQLSDDGLDYAATQYRVTGTMPSLGMGKTPDRARVINRTAEQAKALGQTPAAALQKQAAYKADGTALTKMRTMSSAAESYENKALGQADIVDGLSQKVNRTQWPIVNQAIIAGKTDMLGDSNAQQFVNAITTFSTEYAKIMEGSTGSAAGSTDAARKAAERLISARLNKGTLRDTLALMKREMRLTIQGYDATIAHITERMGGPPPAASAPSRFEIVTKGPK